jgi:hypothetical protein
MPRWWDIQVLMACICLGITLVNGLGIFAINYMEAPAQPYTMSDMRSSATNLTAQQSPIDEIVLTIGWMVQGVGYIAMFALNFIGFYSTLTTLFHVPPLVAGFISGLFGLFWASFLIQFITGRYWKLMDA